VSGRFTRAERHQRACARVAMLIRGLWEEKGSSDTRLLEEPLLSDAFTVVGRSEAFTGRGRREHVVPRLVVIQHCHALLEGEKRAGRSPAETDKLMAEFIQQTVKIVLISPEEARRLDSAAGHGWRQQMPPGWAIGDDVFHRLHAAGIAWTPDPVVD